MRPRRGLLYVAAGSPAGREAWREVPPMRGLHLPLARRAPDARSVWHERPSMRENGPIRAENRTSGAVHDEGTAHRGSLVPGEAPESSIEGGSHQRAEDSGKRASGILVSRQHGPGFQKNFDKEVLSYCTRTIPGLGYICLRTIGLIAATGAPLREDRP